MSSLGLSGRFPAVPLGVGVLTVFLAALALFATLLDQGQLLLPVLGNAAQSANYLHELAHDGRHLLGAPCH